MLPNQPNNGQHQQSLPFNQQQMPPQQAPQQWQGQPQQSPWQQQPQMPPAEPQFDINAWAQANQIDVNAYGGPQGLLDTLMKGVDHASDLQNQLTVAQQAQQVAASADQSPDWRQYEQFLTQGPDGKIVPVQGAEFTVPVGALQAANTEQTQRKETLESLLSNPKDYMQEHLGSYIQEQAKAVWQEQQEAQKRDQTIASYLEQNAGLIYTPGPDGRPTDQLSPRGERLIALAKEAKEQGVAENLVFQSASQQLENEIYREHLQNQQHLQQVQAQMQQMQSHPQYQQMLAAHQQQQFAQQPQGFAPSQGQLFAPEQQPPGFAPQLGPNNGNQPPQNPSFLEDRGLPPQGAGSWNAESRQESPSIDTDVEQDPEDILKNELTQRGVGNEFN